MTIALTAVVNQPSYKSWTVTCADADTTATIAHGFGSAPDLIMLQPVFFQGGTNPNWAVNTVTATCFNLVKANAASSGGTTPGTTIVLKVVAMLPHSGIQG